LSDIPLPAVTEASP